MQALLFSLLAASIYVAAALLQWLKLSQQRSLSTPVMIAFGLAATGLHAAGLFSYGGLDVALQPGVYRAISLILCLLNLALVSSLAWRPLHNLLVIVFPIGAVGALVGAFAPGGSTQVQHLDAGLFAHITVSVLAYAILTLAAFQAAALAIQDRQLRQRKTMGIVRLLPPLQLMETMLFELIWLGVLLLSTSIISGAIFVDDLFAQSMVHKTVFTMVSWLLFATLLWGRYQLGWRSQTAVRFTLSGCAALMLGYLGSKVVLEMILGRV